MQKTRAGINRLTDGINMAPTTTTGKPRFPVSERADAVAAVLDIVRRKGACLRSELIRHTGLSRAGMARCLSELLERGLVEERGTVESTGGRPATILVFRERAGYVLAIDLGLTSIDIAITDLAGGIITHRAEPAIFTTDPQATLDHAHTLIDNVLANTPDLPGQLWGIGMGVPTRVELKSGRSVDTPFFAGWEHYPLRDVLADQYNAPAWVDNDVNIMALGELHAGVARRHDHVIFIKIGTGIGASLIIGGRLYHGAQGLAGDVGHIQVSDDPALVCRCGKFGCLEAVAGGGALARDGEVLARNGQSPMLTDVLTVKGRIEASDIAWAARHGDVVSRQLITEAGRLVGRTLAGLVNIINPSQIVIGGGVSGASDLLLAAIREQVYAHSKPSATRDLLIQRSALPSNGGVIGAASMVANEVFSPDRLMAWLPFGYPVRSHFKDAR